MVREDAAALVIKFLLAERPRGGHRLPDARRRRDRLHHPGARAGELPAQEEGDVVDVRGFLHRDGSVMNVVTPEMFSKENVQYLYQQLGCKTAVGMPFKDVATTDSIFMRTIPPSSDTEARAAIRRLIEVSMGVVVPAEELEKDPLPNAVALMTLEDALAKDGKVRKLRFNGGIFVLINLSQILHAASRRCHSIGS